MLINRDQEIATLKTWVEQLAPKDAEIARLRARTEEFGTVPRAKAAGWNRAQSGIVHRMPPLPEQKQELDRHPSRIADIEAELARRTDAKSRTISRFRHAINVIADIQRPRDRGRTGSVPQRGGRRKNSHSAKQKNAGSWMSANGKRRSRLFANDSWNIRVAQTTWCAQAKAAAAADSGTHGSLNRRTGHG